MQQLSDERLIAYLDGELSEADAVAVEAALERDPDSRTRLAVFSEATLLVREAFDEVLREPIPERLLDACRMTDAEADLAGATILPFRAASAKPAEPGVAAGMAAEPGVGSVAQIAAYRRPGFGRTAGAWWAGLAAASVLGLLFGASGVYFAVDRDDEGGLQVASASSNWLDNIAGYHNLLIASADRGENIYDLPAGSDKQPADVRIPQLKPWGLTFQGMRKIVVDGKPAYQFFYAGQNEPGPLTIFVTTSQRPDMQPTFARRDGVNMLYWRHGGHGYAIVGQADKGWMWNLANDIGFQLKAI